MPNKAHSAVSPIRWRNALLITLVAWAVAQSFPWVHVLAQQQAAPPSTAAQPNDRTQGVKVEEMEPGRVVIDGRDVLTVYESIGSYSAADRAERITDRIVTLAKDVRIPAESVRTQSRETWTEILAENTLLLAVTDTDAKMAGKPRDKLAAEYAGNIRQAVLNYRRERSLNSILRGVLYAAIATGVLALFALGMRKTRMAVRSRIEKWIETRTRAEKKSAFHVTVTYMGTLFLAVGTVLRWLLLLALFEVYLTILLSFFSSTRSISLAVSQWLFSALGSLARSGLEYLPNLLVIGVIALLAKQVLRLIGMLFNEIARGHLHIPGFYPDWADPTAKLVRILVLVLVVVIIFPYLPGSKSPAFQGISIFFGVLLSLGSSSAVANAIAGIILTYMRSFLVGDWVKIGDTTGQVVERNMLVTRVLTPKKEIITIPNGTVMAGSVMNYTLEAKKTGVIFHTTATIGYDAPWRTVHRLLIEAALDTKHVLHQPEPFVLQTALNDFYVSYELNAYTDTPLQMQFIYSELHQNIQDKFNEAGVEICSPHFSSLRDGNTIAIPQQYIARDYTAPAFRLHTVEQEQAENAAKADVARTG